jgi:hypothetical protein
MLKLVTIVVKVKVCGLLALPEKLDYPGKRGHVRDEHSSLFARRNKYEKLNAIRIAWPVPVLWEGS